MRTLLLFFAIFISLQARAQSDGSRITVQLEGLKSQRAMLGYYYGNSMFRADSALVDTITGTVVFEKAKLHPGVYFIAIQEGRLFDLVVPAVPAQFEIHGSMKRLDSLTALNSAENSAFFEYQRYLSNYRVEVSKLKEFMQLLQQASGGEQAILETNTKIRDKDLALRDYEKKFKAKYPNHLYTRILKTTRLPEVPATIKDVDPKTGRVNPNYLRWLQKHYWDNNDFTDLRSLNSNYWAAYLDAYLERFNQPMPDSINAAIDLVLSKMPKDGEYYQFSVKYITQRFEFNTWPYSDQIFVHMVDTYETVNGTPWLDQATLLRLDEKAKMHRPNLTLHKAPPLVLSNEKGDTIDLYKIDARYTLLVFYSPLCDHCKESLPGIYQSFIDGSPAGLKVLAINTDDKFDHWKAFVEQQKWEWINLADPASKNTFERDWAAFNLPVLYLLDKDKTILRKRIDPKDLKDVLKYFLTQK